MPLREQLAALAMILPTLLLSALAMLTVLPSPSPSPRRPLASASARIPNATSVSVACAGATDAMHEKYSPIIENSSRRTKSDRTSAYGVEQRLLVFTPD